MKKDFFLPLFSARFPDFSLDVAFLFAQRIEVDFQRF